MFYVTFLAGSDNVARWGDLEGPFPTYAAAEAHGMKVLRADAAEYPGGAGVRDFHVVEGDDAR